ncbi:PAS domain-containing protein [Egbenema bharatensis]|uniref:PAS domain-containing protein n=1 Tax=Egbenema bharatensis TaxID=3463334 RepID=UPI003A83EECF
MNPSPEPPNPEPSYYQTDPGQQSEEFLRVALEAAGVGVWNWNLLTGEVRWSSGHEKLFGLAPGCFDGQYSTFEALLHPDDRLPLNQAVQWALQNCSTYHHEFRVVWPDGSLHWIEGRGQFGYDDAGVPVWMTGMVVGIDERKAAEAALQERETCYRLLARATNDAIWDWNLVTHQVEWNEAIQTLFGYAPEEVRPDPDWWLERIHADERHQVHTRIFQAIYTGEQFWSEEYRFRRADGSYALVIDRGFVIQNSQGVPLRMIGCMIDVGDRRRVEQELQIKQELLNSIFQSLEDVVWSIALDFSCTFFVSSATESIYGRSPAEFEANPQLWLEVVHPDDRSQVETAFSNGMTTGHFNLEYRICRMDGAIRWIHDRGHLVYDDKGQPNRMDGILTDITQRKETEAALRCSEEDLRSAKQDLELRVAERTTELTELTDRLQRELEERQRTQKILQDQAHLLDLAHDTIMSLDLDLRITFWNHGAEVMYGWSKSTALGCVAPELLHTQFPCPLPELHQILQQKGYWEGELIHTTHEGKILTVFSRWVLQRDTTGEPIAILEINNDITPRKQVEEALRQSEERFRSAFDHASIGMALIGLEGRWLKVNPALCEIVGYSEADLLTTSPQTITHPDDLESDRPLLEQLLQGEIRSYDVEKRYFHRQGHLIWILLSTSLLRDSQERPLYFVSQIQDITTRREVEQVKDEFISIVSHELRTPLTSIRGSLGLLASGALKNHPDRAQRMIEIAAIDIERLVRLVNDILDLERLESGRVTLTMESCSAEKLMTRSIEAMRSIASKENITLTMVPTSAQVWASPDHVIQTLTNLLSNAIKFSPPHSTVWVYAEVINPSEASLIPDASVIPSLPHVQFCVQDQGRGIPPDHLESVFGRFQQVDASDSRKQGGTGLGLAICQSIVHQHGGKIWVTSTLGQGSCFYFTLPIPSNEESTELTI